jgi:hypothetical protein
MSSPAFYLSVSPNDDDRKVFGDKSRKLRIKWPTLGSPRASWSKRNEALPDRRAFEELVHRAALIVTGIKPWPDLIGLKRICTIAEGER